MRTFARSTVLTVLLALSAAAWSDAPLPDQAFELLGHGPWPGMTAWDAAWCKELVYAAAVVEIREPGKPPRLVWVRDARGWLKPNGFYGLKINGTVVDEGLVWLAYAGRMTNLRVLFTYGSDPAHDVSPFRD